MSVTFKKLVKEKVVPAFVIALTLTVISGCSKQEGQTESEKRYITVKGSDTMVHLVSYWAEAFMQKNPGIEVSVTGGGSGTGIAALLNGTTDICAASRGIKENELTLATQKDIHPNEIVVARDGLAPPLRQGRGS